MQYEYEMFFDDTSPVSIHGWYPIATDRIKDQSRIQEYIDKGILRRIDMKEQDAAHSFDWITHEKAFKLSCPRPTIPPEKLVYQHAVMELKKADAEFTRLRSEIQQKDEIIKWMLPIVERHVYLHGNDDSVVDRKFIIAQAKELLKSKAK